MHSLFRSFRLHRATLALAALFTMPVAVAATHSYIAGHGSASAVSAPRLATTTPRTATSTTAPTSFFFTPNSQWSTQAQNARLSSISTLVASGFLDIWSGTQPANANSAPSTGGGSSLCSIAIGASPFSTPASGSMSNASTWTCTAGTTGTAGFAVLYKSGHTNSDVVWMGSVGTSGANLNLATTSISSGVTVSIASGAYVVNDNASISGQ